MKISYLLPLKMYLFTAWRMREKKWDSPFVSYTVLFVMIFKLTEQRYMQLSDSITAGDVVLFNRRQGSIAHSHSLSLSHKKGWNTAEKGVNFQQYFSQHVFYALFSSILITSDQLCLLLARVFSKNCHGPVVVGVIFVMVVVVQKLWHFVISLSLLKIFTWNLD